VDSALFSLSHTRFAAGVILSCRTFVGLCLFYILRVVKFDLTPDCGSARQRAPGLLAPSRANVFDLLLALRNPTTPPPKVTYAPSSLPSLSYIVTSLQCPSSQSALPIVYLHLVYPTTRPRLGPSRSHPVRVPRWLQSTLAHLPH
jgi:hypothetical protein